MNNPEEDFGFDETKPTIVGHLLIRDAETGAVMVNRRDRPVFNLGMAGDANVDCED